MDEGLFTKEINNQYKRKLIGTQLQRDTAFLSGPKHQFVMFKTNNRFVKQEKIKIKTSKVSNRVK